MKHKFIYPIVAFTLAMSAVGCGSGKSQEPALEEPVSVADQESPLADALGGGNLSRASQMADSMSLFVDDFTPDQTVQVLMAFLQVHNDAVANKQSRRDLETLRKYIDVYDIALSVNPKDTRKAFDKARRLNPAVDFDSLARVFRDRLTQYDAIHDSSMTSVPSEEASAPDSAAQAEEIPLELRPAQ